MINRPTLLSKKLRSVAWRAFNYLEKNNNTDFHTNGEKRFLDSVFEYFDGNEGLIFFDVGANVGAYTQMLLERSISIDGQPAIHVFEPTETCFQSLQENFSHNAQVWLNKKAASNDAGIAQIFYSQPTSGLASLHKRHLIEMDRSEMIELIRLDTYINQNEISHIHLLKVDVEGHEMSVFEGMADYLSGEFIDFVQFEYGGANLDSHTSLMDLYSLFEKTGFCVTKVMPGGLEVRPYQAFMENFQYSNYVAISKNIVNRV